ncbi:hypothetical protein LguiB_027995 [Lonicera macranthoides]
MLALKTGVKLLWFMMSPPVISCAPLKQLIVFQRVFVKAGTSEEVRFVMNACKSLFILDVTVYRLLLAGGHTIVIGDNVVSEKTVAPAIKKGNTITLICQEKLSHQQLEKLSSLINEA